MRFHSHRRLIIVGGLLAAAVHASPAHGDEQLATLRILSAPQFEPTSAVSSPSILRPALSDPPPLASPPQPATPPATTPSPPVVPRDSAAPSIVMRPLVGPQQPSGYSARAAMSQMPRRPPIQPSPSQPIGRQGKPFETIHHEPTISPYLNLDRDEVSDESIPNYYTFVRPQLDQLEANRRQRREIQQLRGQLQSMSSTFAGPRYQPAGTTGSGTAARYMDTAQFYGAWRR